MRDASRFVRYLRSAGGLDEYFGEYDDGFGETEQIELDVLEQATAEAAGKTVQASSARCRPPAPTRCATSATTRTASS